MGEIWKDIQNYEGSYQVSNYGRVKSLSRVDSRGNKRNEKILKGRKNRQGYYDVALCKNGKRKYCRINRLVAEAFIPNPNNYPITNHKDENPSNNHVDNLEWCTYKYNNNYGTCIKRRSKSKSKKVVCINTGEIFNSIKEAANITGANASNITQCCKGKCKSTGIDTITKEKLEWKYVD